MNTKIWKFLVWGYNSALTTPDYFNNLLPKNKYYEPTPPYPPSEKVAYIKSGQHSPVIVSVSAVLTNIDDIDLVYKYTEYYEGIRYYEDENDTVGIVIDNNKENGIFIDRGSENNSVLLYNKTGESIIVQRLEFIKKQSNNSILYLKDISHIENVIISSNCDFALADEHNNIILYNNEKKITGIRIYKDNINGSSIECSNEVYISKRYDTTISDFVVTIFNKTQQDITVNSIECNEQSVEPQKLLAYLYGSFKIPKTFNGNNELVDENNIKTVYDYKQIYNGIKYYESENDTEGVIIDNDIESGVYLTRSHKWPCLALHNESASKITVYSLEYSLTPSNHKIAYLLNVQHSDVETIDAKSNWILTNENNTIIDYDGTKKYIGVLCFKKTPYSGGCIDVDNDSEYGISLGKKYDFTLEKFILVVYNNNDYEITINSIEYFEQNAERPPEPDGVNGYISSNKKDTVLIPNTEYVLYSYNGLVLSYEYKQNITIVGIYDSDNDCYSFSDIKTRCYHNGTSWVISVSTIDDNVVINRVKFNVSRIPELKPVVGGIITTTNDYTSNYNIDIYTTLSIDH